MYSEKDGLLTIDEAAARLRIRPQSLRVMQSRRQIGWVRIGLNAFVPESEVERILALRRKRTRLCPFCRLQSEGSQRLKPRRFTPQVANPRRVEPGDAG